MEQVKKMGASRFDKFIGNGSEIDIEGEKFLLKPLSTRYIPDFLKAMKPFAGMKPNTQMSTEDFIKGLTEESLNSIRTLLEATLEKSFKEEWNTDPEKVKEFGMKYFMVLLPKILEINSVTTVEDKNKLEKIKERLNAGNKE